MISHKLNIKTVHSKITKTEWVERIYHIYGTKRVKDENHFILKCLVYTHIRSQFQNICYFVDLSNLLSYQNYYDIKM